MDALSEVLGQIRLKGAVFLVGEFSAPWSVVTPDAGEACRAFMPQAEHLILFHLVMSGRCQILVDGHPPQWVEADHAVILPHGARHRLASDAALAGRSVTELLADADRHEDVWMLRHGGGGEPCRVQCGFLACDPQVAAPLLGSLPGVMVVSLREQGGLPWIPAMLEYAAAETAAPSAGSGAALAKLSELLFVEAVRRHLQSLSSHDSGWLAGLRDRVVARTLALIHQDPAQDWTAETLARSVGASRSVISQRFSDLLQCPPMAYLTQWRMRMAAQMLRESSQSIERVAGQVGYRSVAAFTRAFKRELGVTPARWRKGQGRADIAGG
ncbi:MAG: AraC family transcriptional regulator [Nevskiales bacterium]|nr:AraC family transcriptional regulator [Nevskiales bacterium]